MQSTYDIHNPLLVSSELLLGSQDAAVELGIDLSASLAISGLEREQFHASTGYLPLHQVVNFLNDVAERFQCPHFGFLVAKHQPPLRFAVIGNLVRFAANLGEAIQDALQFSLLNSEYSRWYLTRDNSYAMLIRTTRAYYDAPLVQLNTLAITLVYKALADLVGDKLDVRLLSFTHSPPASNVLFERYFQIPVAFEQEFNGIVIAESCLEIPIATADKAVHDLLTAQCETLNAEHKRGDDIVAKVLHHIKRTLGSNHCNLDSAAQLMGQNPRTLQRELKKHNVNFRALLQEVRLEMAEHYLRDSDISLVELSDILGYQNPSAFSRAFKNATALSPEHWKSSHAPSGAN